MTVNNIGIFREILRYQTDFIQKYEADLGWQLLDAEIRINWACNAKCKMCGIENYMEGAPNQRKRLMTTMEIKSLITQLNDLGCESLTFSGGEPLLRKDLTELVDFSAKTLGIKTSINTNGVLLTPKKIDQLIAAGIDHFTFSVLSPVKEVNNSIMVLNKGLDRLSNSIDYLHSLRVMNKKSADVYINTVILRDNVETLDMYNEFFKKHPVKHINFSPASVKTEWDEWTATEDNLRPSLEQINQFKEVTLPQLNKNEIGLAYNNPFEEEDYLVEANLHGIFTRDVMACYVPMFHTVIQSNGDVIPCCYAPDDFFMGNVLNETLKDIWQGAKYQKFRAKSQYSEWSMCNSCNQYKKINKLINQKVKEN